MEDCDLEVASAGEISIDIQQASTSLLPDGLDQKYAPSACLKGDDGEEAPQETVSAPDKIRIFSMDSPWRGISLSLAGDIWKTIRRSSAESDGYRSIRINLEDLNNINELILKITQGDNTSISRLRQRLQDVGIYPPRIEVRFENLSVVQKCRLGPRSTPSVFNAFLYLLERPLLGLLRSSKTKLNIINNVSGIVKPSRLTLLLGAANSGKTAFLQALAGSLWRDYKVAGKVSYNGHTLNEFNIRRTSAYISQYDLSIEELTVRETLDFYAEIQGIRKSRYAHVTDILRDLVIREKSKREADSGPNEVEPPLQETLLVTDYTLMILCLDKCANGLFKGVTYGERKLVSAGEMLVGPANAFFMDEISTGLDASTAYQILKNLRQIVHLMDSTMVVSLVKPSPDIFELFEDLILLSEGRIVYQGPRDLVLEFFEFMLFRCPPRKDVCEFLVEVTSRNNQRRYWAGDPALYRYVAVEEFVRGYSKFHVGECMGKEMEVPYDKESSDPGALVFDKKHAISNVQLFKACFHRERLVMKRNTYLYVAKVIQITAVASIKALVFFRSNMHKDTVRHASVYLSSLYFGNLMMVTTGLIEFSIVLNRLPVVYKERDLLVCPGWAYTLPMFLVRIPWSILESSSITCINYFIIGYTPEARRFFTLLLIRVLLNQACLAEFRLIAALGRTRVAAQFLSAIVVVVTFISGGYPVARDDIHPWWFWVYWINPIMYAQQAVAVNEMTSSNWSKELFDKGALQLSSGSSKDTFGVQVLKAHGLETNYSWIGIGIGALLAFIIVCNVLFTISLQYFNPEPIVRPIANKFKPAKVAEISSQFRSQDDGVTQIGQAVVATSGSSLDKSGVKDELELQSERTNASLEQIIPFQPLAITFDNLSYSIGKQKKKLGTIEDKLQLLQRMSGTFRPGILTAIVGESGSGKTTLLDVLAGRKSSGYIEGKINIAEYSKTQSAFARVAGYCEQKDIHSPWITVMESLAFSALLRLPSNVHFKIRMAFVESVLGLLELDSLRNVLVGIPNESGLSREHRRQLTIAVELVANPPIIFMDEPISGMDARAAATIMRTIRSAANSGRTVVCSLDSPSVDIFEAFDEVLLLKSGGQLIYSGPIGHYSRTMIDYFEVFPSVPRIKQGSNPATWVLDISCPSSEVKMGLDFAEVYRNTSLFQRNKVLIQHLSKPVPRTEDLQFSRTLSRPYATQFLACLWKMQRSYWHNPSYIAVRFILTLLIGLIHGTFFWGFGKKRGTNQDLLNLLNLLCSTVFMVAFGNAISVQQVVLFERDVQYREQAAGMYDSCCYSFAQILIEVPHTLIQSILFVFIVYPAAKLEWAATKFFWFLFLTFFVCLVNTYWGMFSAALTPNRQQASIVASSVFEIWALFSLCIINRPLLPKWWRWFSWCVPTSWSFYGYAASQLGDVETIVVNPTNPGVFITVKEELRRNYSFDRDFLVWVAVEEVCLALALAISFVFLIKYLNFRKR